MLSCEREKLGTSDRMIITTAAAEGVKRRAYEKRGEWQDAVLFAMLQEELPH